MVIITDDNDDDHDVVAVDGDAVDAADVDLDDGDDG